MRDEGKKKYIDGLKYTLRSHSRGYGWRSAYLLDSALLSLRSTASFSNAAADQTKKPYCLKPFSPPPDSAILFHRLLFAIAFAEEWNIEKINIKMCIENIECQWEKCRR